MFTREITRRQLLPRMILALALLASPALADWDDGEPYKWVQHPDLSPMGIDVNCQEPFILADENEIAPGERSDRVVVAADAV